MDDSDRTIVLEGWTGPWAPDDPDANFKADVALYALVDPLSTIRNLSQALDIPVGAVCHYVLAKWATAGSGGLLELGPTTVRRLAAICDEAEEAGTDEARLAAYHSLSAQLRWLRLPLDQPEIYGDRPADDAANTGTERRPGDTERRAPQPPVPE